MARKVRLGIALLAVLLTLNAVLLVVQPGLAVSRAATALPRNLAAYFYGPRMVRAEVLVWENGAVRDLRVDKGRITALAAGSIHLRERDGTDVQLTVAPDADITVGNVNIRFQRLRRGMLVTTVRDGDGPVHTIRVGE